MTEPQTRGVFVGVLT